MTQSFFGNLFGNGSAHALLQEQLLQLIGATRSLQQEIRQGDQSAQLELGSLNGPLRELCQEFNTVLALLGSALATPSPPSVPTRPCMTKTCECAKRWMGPRPM